jgi:hypothetical protein
MPEAGGEVPCKKSVRIIYTNIVLSVYNLVLLTI